MSKAKCIAGLLLCFLPIFILPHTGSCAVSEQEAAKLKTVLTPLGAEKKGNAEGVIPEWNGGYTTVGQGYASGEVRPDPFSDEKPRIVITTQNFETYSSKLTDGIKMMYAKLPGFRMDVYPTHRTAAAPPWVYENTYKNATSAKTTHNGYSMEGAFGGVPFPIPKNGYELMWNHLTAWMGTCAEYDVRDYIVLEGKKPLMVNQCFKENLYPYYMKFNDMNEWDGNFRVATLFQTAPPFKAGESILVHDPVDMYGKGGRSAWQYLTGQRRVRRSPTIAYDTPNFVGSGFNNFDEDNVFSGALDRYEWKMIGKNEYFIPYNCNKFYQQKDETILDASFLAPDYVRWELHRVWIVEGTLAPGKRHVVPKRRFYLDEDTYKILLSDSFDANGALWKTTMCLPLLAMEIPAIVNQTSCVYDFSKKGYYIMNWTTAERAPMQYKRVAPPLPMKNFSPESLVGRGVR